MANNSPNRSWNFCGSIYWWIVSPIGTPIIPATITPPYNHHADEDDDDVDDNDDDDDGIIIDKDILELKRSRLDALLIRDEL